MKRIMLIFFSFIIWMQMGGKGVLAINQEDYITPPRPNDVHIGPNVVAMPVDRILLVRKDSEYCAIKFTKFWSENTSEVGSIFVPSGSDEYANYESYYQGDKTGDFSKKNVQFKKEKLSFPKPRGIGRLAFSFGNMDIQCGYIKLQWTGKGSVYFYKKGQKQGDYGIEFAPTQWTDIAQVNVFDQRLRWYRYDSRRKNTNISVDELFTAPLPAKRGEDIARQENVYVKADAVGMPIGRITLIRKGSKHCAIKFTDAWVEQMNGNITYSAKYESYYQGDETVDFSRNNMKFRKGDLFEIPNSIVRAGFVDIDCVKMTLNWSASKEANWINFAPYRKPPGDYGIELAPTKWTDISQVNVFDSRLKWYRYDEKRKDVVIPIDQLWVDKENEK